MDEESLAAEFRKLRNSKSRLARKHASFFEAGRDYQCIMELEVARELADSLVASGSMEIEEVTPGDDPPDCIFILADGRKFAVEVTELVNRVAIEAHVKNNYSVYRQELFDWDQNSTRDRIMERLAAKSKSAIKYHADHDQSIVLMYTDEMMLHGRFEQIC